MTGFCAKQTVFKEIKLTLAVQTIPYEVNQVNIKIVFILKKDPSATDKISTNPSEVLNWLKTYENSQIVYYKQTNKILLVLSSE